MRKPLRLALAATVLALVPTPRLARADSFSGIFEPDYASDDRTAQSDGFPSRPIKHLVYPVLGFPSLVEPADTIGLKVLLADGGGTTDWVATLETAASSTPERVGLTVTGNQQFDPATNVYTVEVAVPARALPGVYDLVLESASLTLTNGGPDRQPDAVRVLRRGRKNPSFVVVADSQLEDVRTTESPDRLRQMLAEIRLRDPDFVLFAGDLCFGSDYGQEYEENWKIYAQSGLAIFFVPGNHDGYATVAPPADGSGGPGTVVRDGLRFFRRYLGPTLYSFDWLGLHFVGINSMGGSPERRNASGILAANYGGTVNPDELDWIEQDVGAATAAGKRSVLFLHHDPSATVTPDKASYPVPVPALGAFQSWNDPASQDRLLGIVANDDVSHVLFGHIHKDGYHEVASAGRSVPFVATTTLLCGHPENYGYRWVRTKGGTISGIHHKGLAQQSVPFPLAGGVNIESALSGVGDGSEPALDATVVNRLDTAVEVARTLVVQPAPGGLRARGSALLESVSESETGAWIARVRALVPGSSEVALGVEPDPRGHGLHPGETPRGQAPPSTRSKSAPAPAASGPATKNGPALALSEPLAGTFTSQGAIQVSGTVDPASAVSLTIHGNPVVWSQDGAFSETVALAPGLNVIEVNATNAEGRPSRQLVSVVSGELPASEPIHDAFAVRINQGGLDAVARLAGGRLTSDALASGLLARNPLYSGTKSVFGVTVASAEVNATSASFGAPSVSLAPSPDGISVHVEIPSVDVSVEAHSIGGVPYSLSGHVTADRAIVDATLSVSVASGSARSSVVTSNLSLDQFAWGLDGFPGVLTGLVTPLVRKILESEVEKLIGQVVPAALDSAIAGGLGKPIAHDVLGTQARLTVAPSSVAFDQDGESLAFAANVAVDPLPGFTPLPAAGSLVTRGGAPLARAGPGLAVSINQDLLDRAGFEAWQSGLMNLRLDATTAGKFHLPATLPLDAGFVGTFLPELQGKLPAGDPVAFVLVPRLPPVFDALAAPDALEVQLGGLELDLYDVALPGNPTLVLSLDVAATVKAGLLLDSTNHLRVVLDGQPRIVSSLLASPIVPELDALGVANLLDMSLPALLDALATTWPGIALPVSGPIVPASVSVHADGAQGTFVTIEGDP